MEGSSTGGEEGELTHRVIELLLMFDSILETGPSREETEGKFRLCRGGGGG